MEQPIKYAIGEQDFKSLRERNCLYVDKTEYINRIVSSGSKYYFLARPRRFGKSLFLSTLKYFFEGDRKLFKGLKIDSSDWDWEPYPVLRLDLNEERYAEADKLEDVLSNYFQGWEERYGITPKDKNPSQRFKTIIETAHRVTGKQVVILVDEYDKPLVGNLNDDVLFEHYRAKLGALYSNFKSSASHIRLVFLTGVSRFSKLSVFSDLNNLRDISFSREYSDICGITEQELSVHLRQGIDYISACGNKSPEEVKCLLKRSYDGYKFAKNGSEIYNPWSLLNAMNEGEVADYWNQTGFPTLIVEALKRTDADLEKVLNARCDLSTLTGLDLRSTDPLALLYQTGYMTIKDYDRDADIYILGVPNNEVRQGFFNALLPYYVNIKRGVPERLIVEIIADIRAGKPRELMEHLDTYFAGIPYELKLDNENNFQNAIYILLTLIGIKVRAELSVSDGRIDLLIETEKYVYIIELKYDRSAKLALRQIEIKRYADAWKNDKRVVFRIGASFSSKTRRFKDIAISEF